MRTGTLRTNDMDEVQVIDEKESFSFTSGDRELTVAGMLQRIETPAIGGDDANSLFQKTVVQALDRARKAGQSNPIIVGAIPFDPAEASCLYIPEHAEWRARNTNAQTGAATLPELIEQMEYRATIEAVCRFLEGKSEQIIRDLRRKMARAPRPQRQQPLLPRKPAKRSRCAKSVRVMRAAIGTNVASGPHAKGVRRRASAEAANVPIVPIVRVAKAGATSRIGIAASRASGSIRRNGVAKPIRIRHSRSSPR